MKIYTESFLKTKLHCSYMSYLGGDVTQLDLSQDLFLKTLKELNLLLIKQELKDLDADLYNIIKKNMALYCSDYSIDDAQSLINYIIGNVYSFLKIFPLKDYHPLIIDSKPILTLTGTTLELNFDFIFKQNNKSNYMHGIVFVKDLNEHTIEYDYFNYLKLKFLKSSHSGNRNLFPATKLHLISIKPLTYRNKNLKNYVIKKKTLTEKDIDNFYLKELSDSLSSAFSQKPKPIPACANKLCPKRKECASTYKRQIYESR
jgi:hypothetical protein